MTDNERLSATRRPTAIGITGHRFLTQTDDLISAIDAVLDRIAAFWSSSSLVALSALAEGSDRLAAQRILVRPQGRLVVPLPMSVEEYVKDFVSVHSQDEFRELLAQASEVVRFPPTSSRPRAYEQAGQYIIDHCDVLVALWNGQPPQGDGGTGAVVARARILHRPLIWIYADNQMQGHMLPSSPLSQGVVTTENF